MPILLSVSLSSRPIYKSFFGFIFIKELYFNFNFVKLELEILFCIKGFDLKFIFVLFIADIC